MPNKLFTESSPVGKDGHETRDERKGDGGAQQGLSHRTAYKWLAL
jgi:hypothetical protein